MDGKTDADTPAEPIAADAPVEPIADTPTAAPQAIEPVAAPDAPPEPPAPEQPPLSPQEAAIDAAIQSWLYAEIANSPVSQSTEAWNHLTSKLGQLRDTILKGA